MSQQQVGRLAMREEGNFWNAYYAQPDTMDGAILIGSIRIRSIANNPELRDSFLSLMREAVTDTVRDVSGETPEWGGEIPAPEHERAGHS